MGDQPLIMWDWVFGHLGDIFDRLIEHIELTVVAVMIGFLISFPLAVFSFRHKAVYAPVTWIAGFLYTIPSIALFVLLIPIFGLSFTSAEVALVSYTLLILIRNTNAALRGVPDDVREAALGMGYTRRQLLWKIEIPLALPGILAGVRIATVTTIGLVTVAALIGRGGLGYFIIDLGFYRFFNTAILLGSTLSIAFAVAAEASLQFLERRLTPWSRHDPEVIA